MSTPSPLAGLYQLNLLSEKPGLLGAPVFHVSLLVYPSASTVSGVVHISQSVTPQSAAVNVQVQGTLHTMVFGAQETKVITLTGRYVVSVPPPAIGSYLAEFAANIVFQGDGYAHGLANYHWGTQIDINVPTHTV